MNDDVRQEQLFAEALHDLAPSRAPDRLRTQVKAETSDVRPRPRWLALIQQPPMRTNSRLAVGSPTARVAAIAAATLLLVGLALGASFAGARIIGVDGLIVVDSTGGGHYTTISEAVANAVDGDEILVRPGTYTEAVVIAEDITLRGDGPVEDIVITAPQDGPTVPIEDGGFYEDPYALLLQRTDATVSGLTFRGQPSEVIASGGAPTLENLVFDRTGYAYDGSTASPAGCSIVVNRGSAAVVRANTITGGGPIGVFDGSEPLIEGNWLSEGPHIFGFGFGDGAVIRENTVEGVLVRGVGVFHTPAALLIEGNTILDAPGYGIEIQVGSPTARGNIVSGAGTAGISASASGSNLLDNRLSDNPTGILFTAREGQVTGNVVRGGLTGIMVSAATSSLELAANDVEGASVRGMSLLSGSPTLRDNRLCGNGENLWVAEGATPDIDDSNEICEDAPVE
jgi:nitrous oxidase accessory protein